MGSAVRWLASLTVLLFAAGGASCASLASRTPPAPSPGDSALARKQLADVLASYWSSVLPTRPYLALQAGFLVNGFPALDYESSRKESRGAQDLLRTLDRIDVAALSPDEYLTFLAMQWEVSARAEGALFFWSDFSDLSPAESPLREMLRFTAEHPLRNSSDLERYLYLLDALAFELPQFRAALEERRARGYVASQDVVRSSIRFLRGVRDTGDQGAWRIAADRIGAVDSASRVGFMIDANATVSLRILPAIDSLTTWLEREYLPTALPNPGLWQYPGGKEHYRHLLRRKAALDITPEQAHGIGLATLRRVDSLMAGVRRRMGGAGGAFAFHDSLRRALPAWDDSTLVARARETQLRLATRIAARVLAVPPPLPAIAMASRWEALLFPDGRWLESERGSGGRLLLTPRWATPTSRLTFVSRIAGEGEPGRALQRSVALARDSLPPFRALIESRSFVEGWSSYAGALAGEMGSYSETMDAYGRLLDEGMSAALLVVDTGIHYLGWSRQQALAVMRPYSLESDAALDSLFVARVVNDPGGGGVATLGAREIAAQRAWMAGALGADFDVRAWHLAVLREGALPPPVLASHLEQWLYEVRRARAAAAAAARDSARAKPTSPKKPGQS